MTYPRELETERLALTAWSRDDAEALVVINADAEVMRYLRAADCAESLAQSERFAAHWEEHGYATEAARAALAHGFADLGLDGIVSLVHEGNVRSRAVAGRLGLRIRERIGVVVVYHTRVMPASATPSRSGSRP